MRKPSSYQKGIRKLAHVIESLLCIIILTAVLFGAIDMIKYIYESYIINRGQIITYEEFNSFLGHVILLAIGIELVVLFTLHSSKALLELLVFAIAHKLLLLQKSQGMGEMLLGILAIALIFIIKKYLIVPPENMPSNPEGEDEDKDGTYIV